MVTLVDLSLSNRRLMTPGERISYLSGNSIVIVFILLACSIKVNSQNLQVSDSGSILPAISSVTDKNISSIQISSDNFYETDSVFSFHSQKGYIPSLINNFGEQASAPFHLKTKQWIITGASLGITAVLIGIDNDIDDWARTQKQKHKWVAKSSPVITELGGKYGVYSVAAAGVLSAAFKDQKGVQTCLLATQAMITSGFWVHILKLLTERERPEADYIYSKSEGGKWYGPFLQFDQDLPIKRPGSSFDSFPSGHSATAYSIATVFATQYSDKKAIPILSYSLATLVGISRLTEHKHWASDVFAGGLLGYICGKEVVANYNKTHKGGIPSALSKSKNKSELTFTQNGNQIGLSFRW